MTVNERLFHRRLTADWSDALRRRDRDAAIGLLEQVEVSEPHLIVDAVFADQMFGF
jgi:hypothetical protein